MAELVHERPLELVDAAGRRYSRVRIWAAPQPGGTWTGLIEFVEEGGSHGPRTDRETTQSNLEGVAYWATGLETTYFEGALERALRRENGGESEPPAPMPAGGAAAVHLRLVTADPSAPLRLMGTRTLVPGMRRYIHNGGVVVYNGPAPGASAGTPSAYDFAVQFGSDNAAAIVANRIWSDLHGVGARLELEGVEVPMHNGAIKDALLGALAR